MVSGSADCGPAVPWRIGITGPDRTELVGVVEVDATASRWAVATSGTAQSGAHILEPHTGVAAMAVDSATAVVRLDDVPDGAAAADACATALVASGERARSLVDHLAPHGVSGLVIDAAGVHDPFGLLESAGEWALRELQEVHRQENPCRTTYLACPFTHSWSTPPW